MIRSTFLYSEFICVYSTWSSRQLHSFQLCQMSDSWNYAVMFSYILSMTSNKTFLMKIILMLLTTSIIYSVCRKCDQYLSWNIFDENICNIGALCWWSCFTQYCSYIPYPCFDTHTCNNVHIKHKLVYYTGGNFHSTVKSIMHVFLSISVVHIMLESCAIHP